MSPGKVEKLCLIAKQAIAARDWDKAKQAYLMALGLRSDSPDIHYGLATVYFQRQELTSAAHHFREVTRLDPLRAGAFINLGAVLNLLGQYDEALTVLRRGIQLDPQRVEGYYNLGLVHRKKGQIDLAIQAYREALRLNPRMADAHFNLGNLFLEKGQPRVALQHYDQALQLRPNWEKAIEGRAHAEAVLNPPSEDEDTIHGVPAPIARQQGASGLSELDRNVDPSEHGALLGALHSTASESETFGKQFQQLLTDEVEPAIKELSSALLYSGGSRSELEACVTRFETALERMRSVQQSLQSSMARLRQHAVDHFPTH
jgi:tetratricopeptide (TPR) repeat protein